MEADKTEKTLRFGCGFAFGLIAGFSASLQWVYDTWGGFAATVLVSAILCGLLAVKFGDKFWYSLKNWWI